MPAKTDPEGDIIHLAVCIERLSSCWQTLMDVKANPGHPLVGPAFRYAVVQYMTLFTVSRDAQGHPRSVPVTFIPLKHDALHKRLKADRHKLHAHADMSVLEGSLAFIDKRGLPIATTTLKHVDDQAELGNIDEFLDLIQGVRNNLFADHAKRVAALANCQP